MDSATQPAKLRTARDRPPYFAGRVRELALLNQRLDDLCETRDPSAGMTLILGVPGVGKTQLAREFADQAVRRRGATDVRWLAMHPTTLESADANVFMVLMKAVGGEEKGRKVADLAAERTGVGGGGMGFRASVTVERPRDTGNLARLLADSSTEGIWNGKALVLTIDELQSVAPAGMKTLRVLHQGEHGCPILLVGIGLQHTPRVLANPKGAAGISRLAQKIPLTSLCEPEAADAVEQNMLALGHRIPKSCVQALAKASQGFPQHIHGYLAGALAAIAQHGSLAQGDALETALAAGHGARTDYYNDRLSALPDQDAVLPVVEFMARHSRQSLRRAEAVEALDNAGLDSDDVVEQAIAHGVLTVDVEGDVSFGIPSFHSHMAERLKKRRR